MNELIKELWNQAAREDSGDTWDSQTQFIERFAQLIVGECAKIAFQNDIAKFTRDGYRIGLDIQKI